MSTDTAPLTDDEFRAVAGHARPERVDADTARQLMAAPAGSRPRVYALWHGQIVSVRSQYDVDRFRGDARAWWISGTTVADLIRRAD